LKWRFFYPACSTYQGYRICWGAERLHDQAATTRVAPLDRHMPSSRIPSYLPTLPRHASAHTSSSHVARTRPVHSRPVQVVAERRSTAGISDDDSPGDSDSDASSDDDGCRSEAEQDGPSPRKNVPWCEIDEQRLRVHKEEGKPWKWIFKKFPGRTEPAIRTRWTIIQQRAE
jgi:hypothetical protein